MTENRAAESQSAAPLVSPPEPPEPGERLPTKIAFQAGLGLVAATVVMAISIVYSKPSVDEFSFLVYITFVVLGLSVGFLLFGSLSSITTIEGRHLDITFRLGGPAAACALTVVGGLYFVEMKRKTFEMLVQFIPADAEQDHTQGVRLAAALPTQSFTIWFGTESRVLQPVPTSFHVRSIPWDRRNGTFRIEHYSSNIAMIGIHPDTEIPFPKLGEPYKVKVRLLN